LIPAQVRRPITFSPPGFSQSGGSFKIAAAIAGKGVGRLVD